MCYAKELPFHDEVDIPLLPTGRRLPTPPTAQGPHRDALAQVVLHPIHFRIVPTGRIGHFDVYNVYINRNNQTVAANMLELIHQLRRFYLETYLDPNQHQVVIRFGNALNARWTSTARMSYEQFMSPTILNSLEARIEAMINSCDIFDFFDWSIEFEVRAAASGRGVVAADADADEAEEEEDSDDDDEDDGQDITLKELPHLRGVRAVPSKKTGLCGFMSLVWGLESSAIQRKRLRAHNLRSWFNKARELKNAMGLRERLPREGMKVSDLDLFVDLYPRHRVVVFDLPVGRPSIHAVFEGKDFSLAGLVPGEDPAGVCLYLLFDRKQSHYLPIVSVNVFTNPSNHPRTRNFVWCHGCLTPQKRANIKAKQTIVRHECQVLKCKHCYYYFKTAQELARHEQKTDSLTKSRCPRCQLICYNESCKDWHSAKCRNPVRLCDRCFKPYPLNASGEPIGTHTCGTSRCNNCGCTIQLARRSSHWCTFNGLKPPEDGGFDPDFDGESYYCFDFESMLIPNNDADDDDDVNDRSGDRHEVNLIVVEQCFTGIVKVFKNLETFVEFCNTRVGKRVTFIAHNLRGYDGRLLYDYLVKELGTPPEKQIWTGQKVMGFTFNGVHFRDSLQHIASALEQFPSIFGLDETQFKKGYFPYKFNTPANQSYVGPLPEIQYYEPDRMKPDKRKAFLDWYHDQLHDAAAAAAEEGVCGLFDLQREMETYCRSDVAILARSMEIYMVEGAAINAGLNPMDCMTIASYALKVYRTLHLPPGVLYVLPEDFSTFARKCLKGGRTDARQLYRRWAASSESLHPDQEQQSPGAAYIDIQSMYPAVQFYDTMPVGKPTRTVFSVQDFNQNTPQYQSKFQLLSTFIGFACVDVTPTQYIHHPILVSTCPTTGKLTADLNPKHQLYVTSVELQMAMQYGYRVDRLHEIHEYQGSSDLFKSYIQTFLKLKLESSGLPKEVQKDATRWATYADEMDKRLGVKLEYAKMERNAGKRAIAKIMLNSLWGKLAQKPKQPQFVTCTAAQEYMDLDRKDEDGEITMFYRERTKTGAMIIGYTGTDDPEMLQRTNVAVASFVSAGGRVRLTKTLTSLGDRVLYHDTDSIVYEKDHEHPERNVTLGKFLGEWEDETKGCPITEFVALGPKSYAYTYWKPPKVYDHLKLAKFHRQRREVIPIRGDVPNLYRVEKTVCKAKGFTLNHHNARQVNMGVMKAMVLDEVARRRCPDPSIHKPVVAETANLRFIYHRRPGGIRTVIESKLLKYVYNKGILDPDTFHVFPFGHERFLANGRDEAVGGVDDDDEEGCRGCKRRHVSYKPTRLDRLRAFIPSTTS